MKTMKKIVAILAVALMLCSILPLSVFAADTYELASSIEVGDTVVLVCESKKMELSGMNGTSYGKGTTYSKTPAGTYALTVEAGSTSGTYAFKTTDGKYLSWSSGNSLATNATKSANSSWKVTFSGTSVTIANGKDNTRKLQWNASSPRFACYTSNQTAVNLYKKVTSACAHEWSNGCDTECNLGCGETRDPQHTYGEATETVAPDCTNAGEKQSSCSACGDVKTETVNALGHNYVDGVCSVCNEAQPLEATITFDDKSKRTEYSTTIQVWKENGITVTNNKASSTTNVGDYANPVRLYANSSVTIEYPGMTKIDFLCNSSSYITALKNSLGSNANITTNGNTVTLILDSAEDSYTIAKLTAQVQLKSITVYAEAPAQSDCEHDYVGVETQAPTCSVEGVMTYTCSKCGDEYTEAIAVIPHDYVEDIIDSTCTATGTKTYECSVCFHSYDETIPKKSHNYVDDVCADCGAVKAYKGTITFDANKTQRTEFTTQIQIWANEGLTFTNNKLTGNNIADYGAPVRIYKNSGIVIEFSEMSKLIIDASGIGSDYLWDATLNGYTYTVENGIYTITFDEPVNSVELTAANQVRANSITAIAAHECVYESVVTAPDCVNGGYTTNTCTKCGDSNVSDITEALGHTYFDDCSAICDVCGYEREVSHNVIHVEAVDATCEATGNIEYWYCDVCGAAWLDAECTLNTNLMAVVLPMADHSYGNDFDANCNACGATREVTLPIVGSGTSASEDVSGVAALFNVDVTGLAVKEGTTNVADYTNATIGGYKLIGMGVIASNGKDETDIPCVYLIDLEADSAQFAARVINIPEHGYDVEISFRSYFDIEVDGETVRIYGESASNSYSALING